MNYFRHDCDCGSCEPQGNWQYIFKGPPEKIVLFATAHKQKGKEIFLGSSTALTLDMLSSVPAIPERNQYETVSEILRTRSEQHWQRALDNFPQVEPRNDRMQRIGEFWELPTSWVVNPVVVSEDERTGIVEITPMAEPNPDGSQQMSIEIGDWTYSGICPFCGQNFNDWVQINHVKEWDKSIPFHVDRCPIPACDGHFKRPIAFKPLVLIDGQHRVRGFNAIHPNHTLPVEERVMFSLIRNENNAGFDITQGAKLFTEITTKGVPLDINHQAYMLYKHGMEGSVDTFGDVNMLNGGDDHQAYATVLHLVSKGHTSLPRYGARGQSHNPFHGRIAPVGVNERWSISSMAELFKFVRNNMDTHMPFEHEDIPNAAGTIAAYFEAVIKAWDRMSVSGDYFWAPGWAALANNAPELVPGAAPPEIQKGIISHADKSNSTSVWLRILYSIFPDVCYIISRNKHKDANAGAVSTPTNMFNAHLPRTHTVNEFEEILARISNCDFGAAGWSSTKWLQGSLEISTNVILDLLYQGERNGQVFGNSKIEDECASAGIVFDPNAWATRPPIGQTPIASRVGGLGCNGNPTIISGQTGVNVYVPMGSQEYIEVEIVQNGVVYGYGAAVGGGIARIQPGSNRPRDPARLSPTTNPWTAGVKSGMKELQARNPPGPLSLIDGVHYDSTIDDVVEVRIKSLKNFMGESLPAPLFLDPHL